VLVLTKPLGIGLITTAGKNGVASETHLQNAIAWMSKLNRGAAQAMQEVGIRCATDITGYGLLGHAHEIAQASNVTLQFNLDALPILDGALEYAHQKQIPGGAGRNKLYLEDKIIFTRMPDEDRNEILFDPQTSGGLLIAVAENKLDELARALGSRKVEFWIIGQVVSKTTPQTLIVI